MKQLKLNLNPSFNLEKCPLCNWYLPHSDYLEEIFENQPFILFAAKCVTHYRHDHIKYYDNSWRNPNYASKNPEYTHNSHENYRKIVNNRAKRQIIKKINKNESINSFDKYRMIEAFSKLKFNDEKTDLLIQKKLSKIKISPKYLMNIGKKLIGPNQE